MVESLITINAKRKIGTVNSFIYGQNVEPATSPRVFGKSGLNIQKDIIELARTRIKIPIIRWPGGNFASQYHWEDGIGPMEKRPVVYDLAWGHPESNIFGTNEFIDYCRLIGAEPYITVNAGSGTAEEAAHWVEYCNMSLPTIRVEWFKFNDEYYKRIKKSRYVKMREEHGHLEPYNVKYWSIGNETWGDFQVGYMSAEENAKKTSEYAKLMKRVDPNIKITGVGMFLAPYWKNFEYDDYRTSMEWNTKLLRYAGSLIDYISVHRYYFREVGEQDNFKKENYLNLLACPIHSERALRDVSSAIDMAMNLLKKDEQIKISFDEWYLGVRTLAHALATARFFNVLQRASSYVDIACGEQWISSILDNGILMEAGHLAFDLYENHGGEIAVETIVDTETYDAKVQEFQETNLTPVSIKGVPYIDSMATLSRDGRNLFIATVNVHENKGEECKIDIMGVSVNKNGTVYELNGPDIMASNDLENPNRVRIITKKINYANNNFKYEFPPHSATIIELQVT